MRKNGFVFVLVLVGLSASLAAWANRIVFETHRDGDPEIYIMKPNGTAQSNLTNAHYSGEDIIFDRRPSICPDGKIVFERSIGESDEDPGNPDIFIMDSNGANQTAVTNTSSASEREPDCGTPPGTHKAHVVFQKTGSGSNQDIWKVRVDGTLLTQLTTDASSDIEASWCKTRVIFVSTRDGDSEIWIMDHDGQNQTQLTNNNVSDREPACSPDGAWFAWKRQTPSVSGDIYKAQVADPTNETNLMPSSTNTNDFAPSWSPDGESIAFAALTHGEGIIEVYTMGADGSNRTQITNVEGNDYYPDWGVVLP